MKEKMPVESIPLDRALVEEGHKFVDQLKIGMAKTQHSLEETAHRALKFLGAPKNIDLQGRFVNCRQAILINRVEVIAQKYNLKTRRYLCDGLKNKLISVKGLSRDEILRVGTAVVSAQAEERKVGLMSQLKTQQIG